MKIKFPIHPFLFACFSVLFLYSQNAAEVPLLVIISPLAFILAITLVFFLILKYVFSNSQKAAFIVLVLLVYVFSYGHVFGGIRINETLAVVLWSLIFLFIAFLVIKTKKDLNKATALLNIFTIVLIIIPIVSISFRLIKYNNIMADVSFVNELEVETEGENKVEKLPDIYYIIFDKYASAKSLEDYYNFDNSDFTDFLEKKGFYVVNGAHSNYLKTEHSLVSSLSLDYIDDYVEIAGENNSDWGLLHDALRKKYKVWDYLESKGYKYIHVGSWYHPTRMNDNADVNIVFTGPSDFSRVLYGTTVFYPMTNEIIANIGLFKNYNKYIYHYSNILNQFDNLEKISDFSEPTFTFAHILFPHDPYVFDKDDTYITQDEADKRTPNTNYLNQLIFANEKIKELTENLLNNSDSPPIIIFQSDEGPYPEAWKEDKYRKFNLEKVTDEHLKEKTGILNAYYLPGIDTSDLYSDITPVNTFRYVFNKYFGADLEILPDIVYGHLDIKHPYLLTDISERVK